MEIRELRAFVAVVEDGGLSAAARRLHVSQSALSQSMHSLERGLGGQLRLRSNAGVRPTDSGETLLREARALIERHDRAVATVLGQIDAPADVLRIGVPLEFPADVLPAALAELTVSHADIRVEVRHASSAAQLASLRAGELDLALVRDHPADPDLDAVLAVEEPMGVILAEARAAEVAEPDGVRLHKLAGLAWIGFARSETPIWYDQVAATLRGHGITVETRHPDDTGPTTPEVKLAAVGTGRAFGLASPGWGPSLPPGLVRHPLLGNPIVRRTWAVWAAASRRRDLATLVAALETH